MKTTRIISNVPVADASTFEWILLLIPMHTTEAPTDNPYSSSNLPSQIIQDLQNGEVATGYSMALGPGGTYVRIFKRPGPRGTRISMYIQLTPSMP